MPLVKLTFCWLPTFFLLENRYDIGVVVTGRLTAVLSTLHRPARTQHIRTAGHGGCCNKTPPDIIKRNNFKKKFENFLGGGGEEKRREGRWLKQLYHTAGCNPAVEPQILRKQHMTANNCRHKLYIVQNFAVWPLEAQTSPPSTTAPFYCWSE